MEILDINAICPSGCKIVLRGCHPIHTKPTDPTGPSYSTTICIGGLYLLGAQKVEVKIVDVIAGWRLCTAG